MNTNNNNIKQKNQNKKTSKKKETSKEKNKNNYYLNIIKDKKTSEENDKKIAEIESEIKKKREEKLKRLEQIQNSRNKELLKLEIKLLRKLYGDLFLSLPNTFKQNNLSFENFIYEFGQKIHDLCDIDQNNKKSSYDNLLKEVNILLLKKYPISPDLTKFNKTQLKKYFYELGINDEWSLIQKYNQEMDKLEEKQRLINIAQSMKNYYNDLNEQIETKKLIIEKEKNKKKERSKLIDININKMKLINKKKIEKLKQNEQMMKMMDEKKIEQIKENEKLKQYYLQNLEQENDNLNENNFNIIKFKLDNAINIQTRQMQNYNQKFFDNSKKNIINTGYSIPDDQLDFMVEQIMKSKQKNNLEDIIQNEKSNEEKEPNLNKIEGIDYEIEKKVNEILSEQKLKKNIND